MATQSQLLKWKSQIKKISGQRERNVNRYILPHEIKMSQLRDKIRKFEPGYNEY